MASVARLRGPMSLMSCFCLWATIHVALAARTLRRNLGGGAPPPPGSSSSELA